MKHELVNDLAQSLFGLKKLVHSNFGLDLINSGITLNFSELSILRIIDKRELIEERHNCTDFIKEFLNISKAGISQATSSLEKKGFITREIDVNNRRKNILNVTEEGKKVLQKQYNLFDERFSKIILELGEENTIKLIETLNSIPQIVQNLNDETNNK